MKRLLCWSVLLFVLLSAGFCGNSQRVLASAQEPDSLPEEPETVVCHVSCDAQPGKGFGKLHDENANTCYQLTGGTRLKIQPESAVSGIYCIFQMPCEWKVILPDGSVKNGGADGFIHEYVAFDRSVDAFEMEFPDGARFGELYAFADGRIPDWVQVWEPPCEKADLMVVPTHADDEYLWFGGAIPYYAGELGYNVQVVYLTNHNNARYRCHELLDGLWTVGVRHYPVMNSPFWVTKPSSPATSPQRNITAMKKCWPSRWKCSGVFLPG